MVQCFFFTWMFSFKKNTIISEPPKSFVKWTGNGQRKGEITVCMLLQHWVEYYFLIKQVLEFIYSVLSVPIHVHVPEFHMKTLLSAPFQNPPHELVYAKLKGYCHWPAKVIRYVADKYDCRFFGAPHQRYECMLWYLVYIVLVEITTE